MTNAEIARVLAQVATMLEMDGANPFRVRAYRECARIVETNVEPMTAIAGIEGRLESIRGIGKDLAKMIRDLVATGTAPLVAELQARYPGDLLSLTQIPGLGPKRVKVLYESLHIMSREELGRAAREGKLRELPGFGEKFEQNLLRSLEVEVQATTRMLLAGAWTIAHTLADHVGAVPGVERAELAGSFRRRKDTVGDLDIVACGGSADAVMDAFVQRPEVAEVLGRGDTKSSVRLGNGLQVDLRLVPPASLGAALLYFTGSKQHNIELRRIALEQGMTLNEYALARGEQTVASRTEEEIYQALGLDWIPPELREASGEIDLAREGRLPRLVEEKDLKGDLHMHTNRTDGRDTLEAMVRAARDRGYAYCAITDHSKALAMARGFNEERVKQSAGEIAAVRRDVPGIEVLHGLEVDIRGDGALDLADDALASLDWVIVSLHSKLDQPGPVVTDRVLRAISHPMVHAMAHPSGRLIGTRKGAALDFEKVFERAAELGVWMEINAHPDRTDLDGEHARLARAKGVGIVIDTDAHRTGELDHVRYGVFAARRAGLTAADVRNTLPFRELLAARRRR